MKIGLVIFDQFTDLDLFIPWDLLNRAKRMADVPWEITILGTEPVHPSISGMPIQTSGRIEDAEHMDAVVITSGVLVPQLVSDPAYMDRLKLNPDRQVVGSMCSGALMLAAKGLLQGKRATTYPTQKERLRAYGVEVVDEPICEHGNVATAAGCLAALDLSSWIIAKLSSQSMAQEVIRSVSPVGRELHLGLPT